jgi:hypothetical protein
MSVRRNLRLVAFAAIAAACCAAMLRAQPVYTASPADAEAYQPLRAATASPRQNLYRGTVECERCHSSPTSRDLERGVSDRVCLTEWKTWRNSDKHSEAYRSLLGERGQRIGQLLGGDVLDSATGCVQCHTTSTDASRWDTTGIASGKTEGVGCEACHGPSSRWEAPHREFATWQRTSRAAKTDLGWTDVHDSVARAELCNSCHIGSAPLGRQITHAMYAAGHPTLSGFEIESFADKLPRHWRYDYEKPGVRAGDFPRTGNILIGSVVAARVAVELVMADAAAADSGRWPELARMDCYGCHHDLREPSWRQQRAGSSTTPVSRPGRPRLAVGCLPLLEVALVTQAGPAGQEEFTTLVDQLVAPFAASAFGDPRELTTDGATIAAWCRQAERRLQDMPLDANDAVGVLYAIADQATANYHDYDTARQLFGAWMVVYGELVANGALPLGEERLERMNALIASVEKRNPFVLEHDRQSDACANPPEKRLVEELLPEMFGNRAKYNPESFARWMSRLSELTKE